MTEKTFKQQVLVHRDRMYRLALRLLSDSMEAEDALQEVFLKMWKDRRRLQEVHKMEGWCVRVMYNHCLDRLRAKNTHQGLDDKAYQLAGTDESAVLRLERRELLARIRNLLRRLPENQAAVFHLREVEELSYQEIAEALEMNMSQVKINLFRARQQMRAMIEQKSLLP